MQTENIFSFAMCGSAGKINPYAVVLPLERQKILKVINVKPSTVDEIAAETGLSRSDVVKHLRELVKSGLVREYYGRFKPNFPIFMVEDIEVLKPMIDRLSEIMKRRVREQAYNLERIMSDLRCSKRGLVFEDLSYIIVGALGFDFKGLDVLAREGLIYRHKPMPGGGKYIFSAVEREAYDLKSFLMWGHSETVDKYFFCTHGMLPERIVRRGLPDIIWAFAYVYGEEAKDIMFSRLREYGRILELLSSATYTFKGLLRDSGLDPDKLVDRLLVLKLLDYIRVEDSRILVNIPFLTQSDYDVINNFNEKLMANIVSDFKRVWSDIRRVYMNTHPAKHGIPMQEAFNIIYHLIFCDALNKCISEGLISQPMLQPDGARYSKFFMILR